MESRFATNMENFNEMIALNVLYLMMSLSDGNPDVAVRQIFGGFFIGVICLYLGVHISLLFIDVCYKVKLAIKKKLPRWIAKQKKTKKIDIVERKRERVRLEQSVYRSKNQGRLAREKRLALQERNTNHEQRNKLYETNEQKQFKH